MRLSPTSPRRRTGTPTTRRRLRHASVLVLAVLLLSPGSGPARASDAATDQEPAHSTNRSWQAPVPGAIVRPADLPAQPWLPGHRGIDLAAGPGASVVAPAPGTVTFAGKVAGRPVLVVSHGALRSTFEPVDAVVPVGAPVDAGTQVGTVSTSGSPHCAPASCVHWGVRRGEQYLDPATLLGQAEPIVLLPVG